MKTGVLQPLHKKLDRKHDEEGVVRLGRHRKPCEDRILPMADVILVILSMRVRGGGDDGGGGGGTGDGGVAHGCFLWENGRSGLEGQCLGGSRQGPGKVRGQIRGKYFSINFFTLAISCKRAKDR